MPAPRNRIFPVLTLVLLVSILSYAVVGVYSRMMADDYCTASEGLRYGAVGSAIYNYQHWAGLFSNQFVKGLFAPFQPQVHSVQTLALIVFIAGGLWLLLGQILPLLLPERSDWLRGIMVLLLTLIILYGAPNLRNVYWWAVLVHYCYPVALIFVGTALAIWLIRQPHAPLIMGLGGLTLSFLTVVVVGAANTFGLFFPAMILVGMGYSAWRLPVEMRQRALLLLGVVGLSAVITFLVVFLAPGNAIRQQEVLAQNGYGTPSLPDLITGSLSVAVGYLTQAPTLVYTLFTLLATLTLLMMSQRQDVRRLSALPLSRAPLLDGLIILALMGLTIGTTVVSSVYGVGLVGPHTMFLPRVVQFLGAAALAYLLTVSLARRGFPSARLIRRPAYRALSGVLVLLLFAVPLAALAYNLALLPSAQTYAADWDARHYELRAQAEAGNTGIITVPPYRFSLATYMNLEEVDDEPGFAEGCAADYYGVQAIRVVDSSS